MELFTSAPHDDVFHVLLLLAILLGGARLLGALARRLGHPSVLGEIAAGVLLGPSLLASLVPGLSLYVIPSNMAQGHLLELVGMIGAMFLLLITGLETDLGLVRRQIRTGAGVSLGGIIVPFATGYILGLLVPEWLVGDPGRRQLFAVFIGTALSISAIPVIAKVLMDLDLMRRNLGQTIIAAGIVDDSIGWILLSIVAGVASGAAVGPAEVGTTILSVVLVVLLTFTAGAWIVGRLIGAVQDRTREVRPMLTLSLVLMFGWGAWTHGLGLEAVLGAFLIGIVLGQNRRFSHEARARLEDLALGVFAPIFFAIAGLRVDLRQLASPALLTWTIVVIAVATFGKVAGAYAGGRMTGADHWTSLAYGAGMNARGAMEIILASVGLSIGILTRDMYTIIVVMALATSMMAPSALRWTLRHIVPSEEEAVRLKDESLEAASLLGRLHRVLMPVRVRPEIDGPLLLATNLVDRLTGAIPLEVTVLTVAKRGERREARSFLAALVSRFARARGTPRLRTGISPSTLILDEASRGYDMLILGATREPSRRVLFDPLIDFLMRNSPTLTLVVRAEVYLAPEWTPKRILIPSNGATAARRAAELGFLLARGSPEMEIIILNVAIPRSDLIDPTGSLEARQLASAREIVSGLADLGEAHGVKVETEVRSAAHADAEIVSVAHEKQIDLILLGTDLRPASQRLFLGPRVERILETAPCPVVVVNSVG